MTNHLLKVHIRDTGFGKEHITCFILILGVRLLTISVLCSALRGTRLYRQSQSSKQRLELHQVWILSGQTPVGVKTTGVHLHSRSKKSDFKNAKNVCKNKQTQIKVLLENIRVFLKEGHSRCCIVGNVFLDELYKFIYDRQTG